MDTRPTIRLAVPQEKNLARPHRELVEALHARLRDEGLRPALDGLDVHRLDQRYEQLRHSQGVIVLALPQWRAQRLYRDEDRPVIVPTEFCHIAAAMAVAASRPLLVLRSKDVALRGALKEGYAHPVIAVPKKADAGWLKTTEFENAFTEFLGKVRAHRHVFLGYSSKAKPMADAVSRFLSGTIGLSVLDWHDTPSSAIIMQNISEAERLTMYGVFLFTKDDKQAGHDGPSSVPRDNVIYEAGFFVGAKGPQSVLILRECGARLPTDLSGFVYLEVQKRSDIAPIERKMAEYFESRLAASEAGA